MTKRSNVAQSKTPIKTTAVAELSKIVKPPATASGLRRIMQRRFEPVPSSVPVESDCVVETEGVGEDTLLHQSGHDGQSKSSRINTTPHTIIDGPGMKFNKHNLRRRRDIGIE